MLYDIAYQTSGYELNDGLLYHKGRICVPNGKLRATLLRYYHDAISAGRLGVEETLKAITRTFTWTGLHEKVAQYIKRCDRCQRDKSRTSSKLDLLEALEPANRQWEVLTTDFSMDLSCATTGYDALMVVVDKLSKSVVLIPTVTLVTGKEAPKLPLHTVYRCNGLSRKIISDLDTCFTSALWQELPLLLQIRLAMSSSFPQRPIYRRSGPARGHWVCLQLQRSQSHRLNAVSTQYRFRPFHRPGGTSKHAFQQCAIRQGLCRTNGGTF
jgi:hypothetical protein